MAVFAGPEIVNTGLVLHLDAANPRSYPGSGTVWTDLSGNGNNGTLVNGVGYNSANNGSMIFDGVNDYVQLTWGIMSGNASYTYDAFFIKYNDTNSNWISYGTAANSSLNQIGIFQGGIGVLNFGNDTTVPASTVSSNTWHMISATHDGITTRLYIDGVLVTSKNTSYTFGNSQLNICRAITGSYYANINLSLVKIYNRALSQQEVRQNFEATRSRYGI